MKTPFTFKSLILTLSASVLALSLSFGQTMQDAIKLSGNEEFEKADNAFKNLISAQPSNGALYYYKGENFYQWGKTDSAQNTFQKGSTINATEPLNYVGLGMVQLLAGDTKGAEDNFFKAKTLSKSKDANVLAKIAEAYILSKNYQGAIDLLNQAINLDGKNPVYHIDMGDALLGQNPTDGSKAIDEYDKALSLDPKSVVAILREGKLWKNARNYQTSLEFFLKAAKLDSTYAPAYRELAEMYFEFGKYDEAIASYKKYLQLNNALSARKRYGEFLFYVKKYDECISVLQDVIGKDSSDILVYRVLGYAQCEKKDCKNGLMNMNTFMRKVQGTKTKILVTDYTYLGKLLSCNGQDSLAVVKMLQAISMMPDPKSQDASDIYSQIGHIYYNDLKYPLAIQYFNLRVQIAPQSPNNVNDYYYLGLSQYSNKQYQAADSSFNMVIKLSSNIIGYKWKALDDEVMDSTYQTGSAIPAFDQYIQKIGTDTVKYKDGLITAYSYYAIYYANKKDREKSTQYCKKIQALDPDNKTAKDVLANLNPPKAVPKKK